MQNILHEIEEGIHIVDCNGITIVYNQAMEKIEGLEAESVIGKHLLEVFPDWTKENSTLLMAMTYQRPIQKQMQTYLNLKGKKITTMNTTYPIQHEGELIGAVEIAKNLTDMNTMSDQILELQSKLTGPTKNKFSVKTHYTFDKIIGKNKGLQDAIKIARRAASTSSSVLIEGETGTGKELIAQSIHSDSERWNKPFIAQNCAALPPTLLESILFGTTKGSFTGAHDRAGLFEQSSGGTLFLDEINSLSLDLQAKLLRVLQEGYVRRLGGREDIKIDVRIIAATNEDPLLLMQNQLFRKDLYYRLNVISIKIPPLKDRADDIPALVDHFIRHYNDKLRKDVWMISSELIEAFKGYQWPGNIRELQNFIESAMNMISDEHVINKEHLPSHVEDLLKQKKASDILPNFEAYGSLNAYLEEIEKGILKEVLEATNHNISKASELLGISRQNLQYKIKKLNE
jgi:arginine utilization regulatory protein